MSETATLAAPPPPTDEVGHGDHELAVLRAHLVAEIAHAIRTRGLTQTAAAELVGLKQSDVSTLLRNRGAFSLERLLRTLLALGHDVALATLATGSPGRGRVLTRAAAPPADPVGRPLSAVEQLGRRCLTVVRDHAADLALIADFCWALDVRPAILFTERTAGAPAQEEHHGPG